MREILFRSFHECENGKEQIQINGKVIKGEWVEGDFVRPCNIVFETIGYDEVLKQDGVLIGNDYSVIPETVGQYTGLKDKNGKKIFEGEVISKFIFRALWAKDNRIKELEKENYEKKKACRICKTGQAWYIDYDEFGSAYDRAEYCPKCGRKL